MFYLFFIIHMISIISNNEFKKNIFFIIKIYNEDIFNSVHDIYRISLFKTLIKCVETQLYIC